jgi:hypothetical protein
VKSLPAKCSVNIGFCFCDDKNEDGSFSSFDGKSIVFPLDLFDLQLEQNSMVYSQKETIIGLACDFSHGKLYASNGERRHEKQLPEIPGLRGLFPLISADIRRTSQITPMTMPKKPDNAYSTFNLKYNFGPNFHFPLEQGFVPFSSLLTVCSA